MQMQADLGCSWSSLVNSSVIFTHQIHLPAILQQMDVALGLDVIISLAVFWALIVTAPIKQKYQLTAVQTSDKKVQVFLNDKTFFRAGLGLSLVSKIIFYMAIGQCNVALFYFCNVATVVGRLNENIKILSYGLAYFMFICKNQRK
ncbi:hypothetical protein TYRP_015729, partial [Tyrophagus putrescentiae]